MERTRPPSPSHFNWWSNDDPPTTAGSTRTSTLPSFRQHHDKPRLRAHLHRLLVREPSRPCFRVCRVLPRAEHVVSNRGNVGATWVSPWRPQEIPKTRNVNLHWSTAQLVYIPPVVGAEICSLSLAVGLHTLPLVLTEFGVLFAILIISHHDLRRHLEGGHAYHNHRAYAR